jgi:hypothetical protein
VSKGPQRLKSGFPKSDKRAPKGRGAKSSEPAATGPRAQPPARADKNGRSGNEPENAPLTATIAERANTDPAPKKPAITEKAPTPSMDKPAVRQLTPERIGQMRERFVRIYGELEMLEASIEDLNAKRSAARKSIKSIRAELSQLRSAINTGVENARQGDLFAHERREAAKTEGDAGVPQAQADQVLAKVATLAEQRLVHARCSEDNALFPLADGYYLDADGRLICKAHHDATPMAAEWPTPELLEASPEKCGKCAKPVDAKGAGFVCTSPKCEWTGVVKQPAVELFDAEGKALIGETRTAAAETNPAESETKRAADGRLELPPATVPHQPPRGLAAAGEGDVRGAVPEELTDGANDNGAAKDPAFAFEDDEPAPTIDRTQAGPTRIEADRVQP